MKFPGYPQMKQMNADGEKTSAAGREHDVG